MNVRFGSCLFALGALLLIPAPASPQDLTDHVFDPFGINQVTPGSDAAAAETSWRAEEERKRQAELERQRQEAERQRAAAAAEQQRLDEIRRMEEAENQRRRAQMDAAMAEEQARADADRREMEMIQNQRQQVDQLNASEQRRQQQVQEDQAAAERERQAEQMRLQAEQAREAAFQQQQRDFEAAAAAEAKRQQQAERDAQRRSEEAWAANQAAQRNLQQQQTQATQTPDSRPSGEQGPMVSVQPQETKKPPTLDQRMQNLEELREYVSGDINPGAVPLIVPIVGGMLQRGYDEIEQERRQQQEAARPPVSPEVQRHRDAVQELTEQIGEENVPAAGNILQVLNLPVAADNLQRNRERLQGGRDQGQPGEPTADQRLQVHQQAVGDLRSNLRDQRTELDDKKDQLRDRFGEGDAADAIIRGLTHEERTNVRAAENAVDEAQDAMRDEIDQQIEDLQHSDQITPETLRGFADLVRQANEGDPDADKNAALISLLGVAGMEHSGELSDAAEQGITVRQLNDLKNQMDHGGGRFPGGTPDSPAPIHGHDQEREFRAEDMGLYSHDKDHPLLPSGLSPGGETLTPDELAALMVVLEEMTDEERAEFLGEGSAEASQAGEDLFGGTASEDPLPSTPTAQSAPDLSEEQLANAEGEGGVQFVDIEGGMNVADAYHSDHEKNEQDTATDFAMSGSVRGQQSIETARAQGEDEYAAIKNTGALAATGINNDSVRNSNIGHMDNSVVNEVIENFGTAFAEGTGEAGNTLGSAGANNLMDEVWGDEDSHDEGGGAGGGEPQQVASAPGGGHGSGGGGGRDRDDDDSSDDSHSHDDHHGGGSHVASSGGRPGGRPGGSGGGRPGGSGGSGGGGSAGVDTHTIVTTVNFGYTDEQGVQHSGTRTQVQTFTTPKPPSRPTSGGKPLYRK